MPDYMRLKVVRVDVVDGKKIEVKKFYSAFKSKSHKGRLIEVSLDAFEHEKRKALVNLGKKMQEDEDGVLLSSSRRNIGRLEYPLSSTDDENIWRLHIKPYFGAYKIPEITGDVIERYIADKWEGDAPESSVKKHIRTLKHTIWQVRPNWKVPKFRYVTRDIKRKPRLTKEQVIAAERFLDGENLAGYLVMAETGMEPMDLVQLAPKHIMGRIVMKIRSKSSKSKRKPRLQTGVTPNIKRALAMVPVPANPETPYFRNVTNKGLSTAVSRAFDSLLYPGLSRKALGDARKEDGHQFTRYGPKDLRRYKASRLYNNAKRAGLDQVAQVLGQVRGSAVTADYVGLDDETIIQMFEEAL